MPAKPANLGAFGVHSWEVKEFQLMRRQIEYVHWVEPKVRIDPDPFTDRDHSDDCPRDPIDIGLIVTRYCEPRMPDGITAIGSAVPYVKFRRWKPMAVPGDYR